MRTLVIFDPSDANAEKLARAIGEPLRDGGEVRIAPVNTLNTRDVSDVDLLAIGGPTRSRGLSAPLKDFLNMMPRHRIHGMYAVTFGTRVRGLRLLTGSAAREGASLLGHKGAVLMTLPESFFTAGINGPLADGEIERAKAWAAAVREKAGNHITPENCRRGGGTAELGGK